MGADTTIRRRYGSHAWLIRGNDITGQSFYHYLGTLSSDSLSLITDSVVRLTIPASGIVRSSAATNVALLFDSVNKRLVYGSVGGTTPTWQQTLDATNGKILTSNNNITGAFAFSFTDPTSFTITKSSISRLLITNIATALRSPSALDILSMSAGTTNLTTNSAINLVGGSSGNASQIDLLVDSMRLSPPAGALIIDSLLKLNLNFSLIWLIVVKYHSKNGKIGTGPKSYQNFLLN